MFNKRFLLEAIYTKTGIYITTKNDCRIVSQLIVDERIGYLSESTLYRFFLHQNEQTKPYKNTLTILAKFCGFKDWDRFMKYYHSNYLFNEPEFLNHSIDVVLKNLIHKEKFNPLVEIFDSLENENYKTKELYGLKTFVQFQNTPLFPTFIQKYGSNSFVRNILMEALYDPKHRIDGYAESIENYLETANKQADTYIQDTVFAHAVLFRHYFLNNDIKAIEIGKKLYKIGIATIDKDPIHLFPKTRFYAYKLWYLRLQKAPKLKIETYLEELMDWVSTELESAVSMLDVNIIYQTIVEVFQHQKMKEMELKLNQLVESKLSQLNEGKLEELMIYDANGLINFLPE